MRMKAALLAAIATACLDHGSPVFAEGATTVDVGDIIVTARKRQESVLKVPVVESVLSAATLDHAQITDIRGITANVPGLIIGSSVLSIGAQISLRGVGTSALDAGIDQSVALNIDGQQFSQGLAFKAGLFDLAQAEVLKGPQALFFGKNSPGGVIALTTADPGGSFDILARGSYEFEAREKRTELILSGPVSDTLGLRLATTYSDSDGFFHNTATAIPGLGGLNPKHRRYGGNENYIIRGTAVWNPIDHFHAKLKVNITRDKSESPAELQVVSCPNGSGPSALGVQFIGGPIPCKQDRNVEFVDMDPAFFGGTMQDGSPGLRNGGVPFDDIRQHFGVLDLGYDVTQAVKLSSVTTYYHNTTDAMINGTSGGAAGPALFADNHFTRREFTQEVRLESDYSDQPLNWMLGGFYQDARMKNRIYVGGNTALKLPAILSSGSHNVGIKSYSAFGQLRWKPIDVVEVAGGVRYTDERRNDVAISRAAATGIYNVVTLPHPKLSSKKWSPELTITYTPTDTFTVFGALKQGYKSGSYSITTPATGVDNSFGDEKVQGGEIGLKSRLMDRQLNLNAAVYYYKYKGLQVGVSQPADSTGVPVLRTLNAGGARTYGIDFDATYRPADMPGLTLKMAIDWNKAKFLSLHGVPCYGGQTIALGCNESFNAGTGLFTAQNASGEPLEKAPQWQVNGGADYETPLSGSLNMLFGGSFQYSSRYKTVIGNRADYYQAAYTKLNAYVTIKDARDRWEVSLIGNNLNNGLRAGYCANSDFQNTTVFTRFAQVTGAATNPTGKIDDVGCVVDAGRQVFIRLTVHPVGLFK